METSTSTEPEVKVPAGVGRSSRLSSSGLVIAITGLISVEIFEVKDSEALDLMIGAKSETAVKPKRRKREKIERLDKSRFWWAASLIFIMFNSLNS